MHLIGVPVIMDKETGGWRVAGWFREEIGWKGLNFSAAIRVKALELFKVLGLESQSEMGLVNCGDNVVWKCGNYRDLRPDQILSFDRPYWLSWF